MEELVGMVIREVGSGGCRVGGVWFEKSEGEMGCEEWIGMGIGGWVGEEERESGWGKVEVDGGVGRCEGCVMVGEWVVVEFVDNGVGCKVWGVGMIVGIGDVDDRYEVGVDVGGGNEGEEVWRGKGGVNEEIVEWEGGVDGVVEDVDGVLNVGDGVVGEGLVERVWGMMVGVWGFGVVVGEGVVVVRVGGVVGMKGEMEEEVSDGMGEKEGERFVGKDGVVVNVREEVGDELSVRWGVWRVSVMDDKGEWVVMVRVCGVGNVREEVEVDGIKEVGGVDIRMIDKRIEDVVVRREEGG